MKVGYNLHMFSIISANSIVIVESNGLIIIMEDNMSNDSSCPIWKILYRK